MKQALILHGTDASPEANWFRWLEQQLTDQDYKVWLPQLPECKTPNIKAYNKYIFANNNFKIDENTTIIGHSSGAVEILGLLQNLKVGSKTGDVYLVSAFKDTLGWDALDGLFTEPFKYELIKENARSITLIHSTNDPYVPSEHAEYLKDKLNAELVVIPNQGHFNTEHSEKYNQFPELFKIMNNTEHINQTAAFIKEKMLGEGTGHDWWHVYRVWQIAKTIASNEPTADKLTVELAALLHDIADWKFTDGDMEAGPKAARAWLESIAVEDAVITHIEDIIRDTTFKGAKVDLDLKTIESKIIFDADKLDAIGAIGIARTFAYGGSKNRSIYEPDEKPVMHENFEDYKSNQSHTVNHFYEKLLLLKDLMYTETGKQMAQSRHKYMEDYLQEFYKEWNGEA